MRIVYWVLLIACTLLLVAPLWVATYPPMVDLPQNAAQLSIWQRWDQPEFGYPDQYRVNSILAHLLVPALVLSLGLIVPLVAAIKIVITLALVGIPASCALLIRQGGGSRWWIFAAFPLGFSYAFYWGFLSYVVAIPLGILLIGLTMRYVDRPTTVLAVGLAVNVFALFFAHVLVMGFAGLASLLMILFGCRESRWRWAGVAALAAVAPLVTAWLWLNSQLEHNTTATVPAWNLGWGRLHEALSHIVGMTGDAGALVVGAFLLAVPWMLGGRPSRQPIRWIPLGLATLIYLIGPHLIFGTAFLYGRHAAFLVPGMLLAFEAGERRPSNLLRLATPLVVCLWLLAIGARFIAFEREAAGFREVLAEMEPGRKVLTMMVDPTSAALPYFPFLHFGQWYLVEKGGLVDFSFAEFFVNRYRYSEHEPALPDFFEWRPLAFDWRQHGGAYYDYYLIRELPGVPAGARDYFSGATDPISMVAASGQWSLFRRLDIAPSPHLPAAEGVGEQEGP